MDIFLHVEDSQLVAVGSLQILVSNSNRFNLTIQPIFEKHRKKLIFILTLKQAVYRIFNTPGIARAIVPIQAGLWSYVWDSLKNWRKAQKREIIWLPPCF